MIIIDHELIEFIFVEMFQVMLENTQKACDMQWHLNKTLKRNETMTSIPISVSVSCSLTGSEHFVVQFKHHTWLKDMAGNSLGQEYVTAPALRLSYLSASEAQAVGASGATLSAASLLTLGLLIGILAFQ